MTELRTCDTRKSFIPILFLSALLVPAVMWGACGDDTSVGTKNCGDGVCSEDESTDSCPEDCTCGNGTCDQGEDLAGCPQDCSACGDDQCTGPEDCASCAQDCGVCPTCGDGECNGEETCETCPDDCGRCGECGNGVLDAGEECDATDFGQQDCVTMGHSGGSLACTDYCLIDASGCWDNDCGDQTCSPQGGETCASCEADCACGELDCRGYMNCLYDCTDAACADVCYQRSCIESQTAALDILACMDSNCQTQCADLGSTECDSCMLQNCGSDMAACYQVVCSDVCGNGTCDSDETSDTCPEDCPVCGDDICSPQETSDNCPADCAAGCGDGNCDPTEDCESCPTDCGRCPPSCGNGTCEPTLGETCAVCPADCTCGDQTCMEIIQCTQGCSANQTCVDECVEHGCYEGQQEAQALYQCMLTQCTVECGTDPSSNECMACMNTNCDTELNACINGTCN